MCEKNILANVELSYNTYAKFGKYVYSGEAVAFNFTTANAKQINNDNYFENVREIDKEVTGENRFEYVTKDMLYASSLKLSTRNGFMHSYAVNKRYIKLSPWYMDREAFRC